MKEIVVLSGKGGTGKTSVAAALSHLASKGAVTVIADADVDAANLGLILAPTTVEEHEFAGGKVAVVEPATCTACLTCLDACRFGAVTDGLPGNPPRIDPVACEGCAACFYRCPAGAIRLEQHVAGRWSVAETRFGALVHAHLFAGQENSGKLVTQVKQRARALAAERRALYLIVDGPPGIGCPVIASASGADLALLVVEPTVAGLHDLERVLGTVRHFRVPAMVCLNKSDLSPARAREVKRFCAAEGVAVGGEIPFDPTVTQAMVAGKAITEWMAQDRPYSAGGSGAVVDELAELWQRLREVLDTVEGRPAANPA